MESDEPRLHFSNPLSEEKLSAMYDASVSNDVAFVRGTLGDAAELAAFAAHSFEQAFAADNRPEDIRIHLDTHYGVKQQTAELIDSAIVTILARCHSELVAYAQVRRKSSPPCITQTDPVELHRFYLDRRMHGKGLAQQLMHEVFRVCGEMGGRHLWLGVWERNSRAIAFYKKCGFLDIGSQIYTVGSDEQTDRVLVLELSAF